MKCPRCAVRTATMATAGLMERNRKVSHNVDEGLYGTSGQPVPAVAEEEGLYGTSMASASAPHVGLHHAPYCYVVYGLNVIRYK